MSEREEFLYPLNRYHGKPELENQTFNANLQKFAQQVSYISNLQTGGKLSSEEGYEQIKALWKQLTHTKKRLGVGKPF